MLKDAKEVIVEDLDEAVRALDLVQDQKNVEGEVEADQGSVDGEAGLEKVNLEKSLRKPSIQNQIFMETMLSVALLKLHLVRRQKALHMILVKKVPMKFWLYLLLKQKKKMFFQILRKTLLELSNRICH